MFHPKPSPSILSLVELTTSDFRPISFRNTIEHRGAIDASQFQTLNSSIYATTYATCKRGWVLSLRPFAICIEHKHPRPIYTQIEIGEKLSENVNQGNLIKSGPHFANLIEEIEEEIEVAADESSGEGAAAAANGAEARAARRPQTATPASLESGQASGSGSGSDSVHGGIADGRCRDEQRRLWLSVQRRASEGIDEREIVNKRQQLGAVAR
ncbi:hypothetical protein Scep_003608 [Stephania cephalantha]|uniref:Uncharacterized protein n=1 Tax=Stephania cephalantha TaxID=152367 RepID=A0AAP0KTE1_9MAGN